MAEQEGLRIRVQRVREELLGVGQFDDYALMYDGDPVADKAHDGQVMGDKQIGQAAFPLQFGHEVQYLSADRDIQRGDGLIGNDEFRVHDQGAGDANTLALTAGKFMRETAGELRQKTYRIQSVSNDLGTFFIGKLLRKVQKTFGYDIV